MDACYSTHRLQLFVFAKCSHVGRELSGALAPCNVARFVCAVNNQDLFGTKNFCASFVNYE